MAEAEKGSIENIKRDLERVTAVQARYMCVEKRSSSLSPRRQTSTLGLIEAFRRLV